MLRERKRPILLGVPLDAVAAEEAIVRIQKFLGAQGQHHVVTPNAEMLVEAARNPRFHEVLERADLALPDSQGVLWMARLTGQCLSERVTGVDTVEHLCAVLTEEQPVFFLGAAEGVSGRVAEMLKRRNPRLNVAGTFAGSPHAADSPAILERIRAASPHLLFVAYGAPAQDLWIAEHLKNLPSVRVAMGVGGTFDFLAGEKRRAPKCLRSIGLEWLWRLCLEPRRIRRIWNAVVVFPYLVLRYGRGDQRNVTGY